MFEKLVQNKYSTDLVEDAKMYIKEDRESNKNIIDYILDFCTKHKLLIDDVDFLLNQRDYWDSISIFTINIDEIAKKLLKELCGKFEQSFMLKVKDADVLYTIEFNNRELCSINLIKVYKNFTLYNFIDPIKHKGIYMMPPFIEIINLYSKLYNPTESANWPSLLDKIKKLDPFVDKYFKTILDLKSNEDLNELISTSFTAKRRSNSINNDVNGINGDGEENSIRNKSYPELRLIKKTVLNYIKDSNYILVNNTAYNIEHSIDDDSLIEVLSKYNIDSIYKLLSKYIDKELGYGIIFKTREIYLPSELLLTKYAIYVVIPINNDMKKIHIMNIYNNMSYELINYYTKDGFRLADPITQVKFTYISIWNSIIAQKIHGLNIKHFQTYLKDKNKIVNFYKNKINIYEKKQNYDGIYVNIQNAKKLSILSGVPFKSSFLCFEM